MSLPTLPPDVLALATMAHELFAGTPIEIIGHAIVAERNRGARIARAEAIKHQDVPRAERACNRVAEAIDQGRAA